MDGAAASPAFWTDDGAARRILSRRAEVQKRLDASAELERLLDELHILGEWAAAGEDVTADILGTAAAVRRISQGSEASGDAERGSGGGNAVVAIHPGAGGTESHEWAAMLGRAYLRWLDRRGIQTQVTEWRPGPEAGMKAATFILTGADAYGLMRNEIGTHRLSRKSPYGAGDRRQTSFAAVQVWPEPSTDEPIEITDAEIRIDTFRASGAGGQHVNKTESAVRITHPETGITVCCQDERSQHRNRRAALQVLKARLNGRRIEERRAEQRKARDSAGPAGFGGRIRSYVLHPYRLVKDHRTGVETRDAERVLNGDFDDFAKAEPPKGEYPE